jgi:hypothetical protein
MYVALCHMGTTSETRQAETKQPILLFNSDGCPARSVVPTDSTRTANKAAADSLGPLQLLTL